ncbi:S8 family serine peptidase [Candidatus Bathyarchaeota archaeon]|nr:S8 family serine peptidase [Candidatus Bathyarchaeota archaeon]MBL7080552.1 S8 family serine peptidase [Candidatus Bathyarchaeota archaeon]
MIKKTRKIITIIIISIFTFSLVFSTIITSAPETTIPPTEPKKKEHTKLESHLERLLTSEAESLSKLETGSPDSEFAESDVVSVQVVFELNHTASDEDLRQIEDHGATIEMTHRHFVQARIPVDLLYGALEIPGIRFVRTPSRPVPTLISEGVEVINADDAQALGYNGSGVKVAIIDMGFDITNPEISGSIVEATSYSTPADITAGGYTQHGTACAEIVLDVAPGAQLYLYDVDTDIAFSNAVDRAIAQGVDVISMSLGWFNQPMDGTGFLCEVVDNAKSNGIFFAISAGNDAERHWEGDFRDDDLDGYHNYDVTDETNEFYAYQGEEIWIVLNWDDWPASDQDYDLLLYDDTLNLVDYSDSAQTGTQSPTETIWLYAPHSGIYYIVIEKYAATRNVNFDLYATYSDIEYYVSSGSLNDPGTAAGAFTVGATNVVDDSLEWYSSRGPTNDGRLKPDACAPADVYTTAYGYSTFAGTSAATPHAAGAAAVLLSYNGSYTPSDLARVLKETALDLGDAGPDNSFGYGRISLDFSSSHVPRVIHVPGDYPTIQEAVDAADHNDTIVVGPGTYQENVFITKNLTIHGADEVSSTIIDGGGNGTCVFVTRSTVAFSKFVVRNSGNESGDAGIKLVEAHGSIVEENEVIQVRNGILVEDSEEVMVFGNNVNNVTYGVNTIDSSHGFVCRNNVTFATYGLLIQWSDEINATYNTIQYCTYGLISRNAWNSTLTSNFIECNTYGGDIFSDSYLNFYSSSFDDIHVFDNSTIYTWFSTLNNLSLHDEAWVFAVNSSLSDLGIYDDSISIFLESSLNGLNCEDFRGGLGLNDTRVSGGWDVNNSRFWMWGDVNFTDVELTFRNSTAWRAYDTYVMKEGELIPNSNLTLSDSGGTIWSGNTGASGSITLFLTFTDSNYSSTFTLQNDDYPAEMEVSFLSSSPVIISIPLNSPPLSPHSPSPSNNSTDASIDSVLSWNCSDPEEDPLTYDVYFGSSYPPGLVASGVNTTSYEPDLDYNTTYYWKVVANDGDYTSDSSLWNFTTVTQAEYTLSLSAGWNMVSLPVIPGDPTATSVMPPGQFFQLVTWSGTGYMSATEFEAGRGYWLLVLEDVNVTVRGDAVEEVTLNLSLGWSMVGGPDSSVLAADVFTEFHQMVTWSGTGYEGGTSFEPGRGYWVLVLEETQVNLMAYTPDD